MDKTEGPGSGYPEEPTRPPDERMHNSRTGGPTTGRMEDHFKWAAADHLNKNPHLRPDANQKTADATRTASDADLGKGIDETKKAAADRASTHADPAEARAALNESFGAAKKEVTHDAASARESLNQSFKEAAREVTGHANDGRQPSSGERGRSSGDQRPPDGDPPGRDPAAARASLNQQLEKPRDAIAAEAALEANQNRNTGRDRD